MIYLWLLSALLLMRRSEESLRGVWTGSGLLFELTIGG